MRKRHIILVICCLLGMQLSAATQPGKPTGNERIFLHHQGKVSLYAADKLSEAIEASVDGDTLFLSNGNYGFAPASDGSKVYYAAKPINVTKSVCLVGEGENTYIGALAISLADSKKACHLYGIKSSLAVNQAMSQLDIQKSYVQLSINASIDETHIHSSKLELRINGWNTQLKTFLVSNSIVSNINFLVVDSDNLHLSLNHCNIYELMGSGDDGDEYMSSFKGAISNSIVDHITAVSGETRYFDPAVTLTNVLVRKTSESYDPFKICKQTNSIALLSNDEILSKDGVCRWSTDELTQQGFLGDDNTVMGIYGGSSPYSLTLDGPTLENPMLDINTSNHKLMFNLDIK